MKPTQKLRTLLETKKLITAPGVFDGLSAKLVEQAGFQLIYASGGAISRSAGYPDLGLLTMDEILHRLAPMVEVTNLPIIADADTGFGNNLNVQRTVRAFERAGVAALHLEDQTFPKRCGHLEDKGLIEPSEMIQKIKAAKDAQCDTDFVVIARTDAIAVEGFEAACNRAHQYLEAGADMIFIEAPETEAQIEQIARRFTAPKLLNMFIGGKTPLVPTDRLEQLGYQIVIIPSDLQRAAIFAMQKTLQTLMKEGNSQSLVSEMVSFKDREKILETAKYLK